MTLGIVRRARKLEPGFRRKACTGKTRRPARLELRAVGHRSGGLIGYRGGVIEVDAQEKTVWHLTQQDLPDLKFHWICNLQRLANGNTVVNNWFIHKRLADSSPFFEVTPGKKVVWRATLAEKMFDPLAIHIPDGDAAPLR